MVWKVCDPVSERLEFVMLARVEGANISALCQRFGISRKTGYKWLNRFCEEGQAGLVDRSRRPHESPALLPAAVQQVVLAVRDAHPAWGGAKIAAFLKRQGQSHVPAPSTITQILRRHGRLDPGRTASTGPLARFEHAQPNDLWQIDFKGDFPLVNGRRCYPLTVLDDHSRYAVGLVSCAGTTVEGTREALIPIFRKYGVPRAIYTDNGPPFGALQAPGRHTRLTVWLMRQDIRVIHGRPYHPQGRGKAERFHRTLNCELLQDHRFENHRHAQQHFDPWRQGYNHERPHQSLDMDVPASRYAPSRRDYRDRTGPFEYSDRFTVRRTNYAGRFKFQGRLWNAGGAFAHDSIGLTPTSKDGVWLVMYGHFPIGELDQTADSDRLKPPEMTRSNQHNEIT